LLKIRGNVENANQENTQNLASRINKRTLIVKQKDMYGNKTV